MKTKSTVGRLITYFSEWRESGARVAAMLLLLCTTALPAWASTSWDTTRDDEGGGTVRYRGECSGIAGMMDFSGSFETKKTFNPDNNQFYWEFTVFAGYADYYSQPHNNSEYIGEIYVMTADSQVHSIANWKKENLKWKEVSYSITDSTWGYIHASNLYDYRYITIQYMPSSRAFEDGVKCIMMKENAKDRFWNLWASVQWDKNIDCTALKEGYPMPKLSSVSWGTDGTVRGVATNVPDKRSDNRFKQWYEVREYYYDGGEKSTYQYFYTSDSNVSITEKSGGKMDLEWKSWLRTPNAGHTEYAYTMPVYLKYRACTHVNLGGTLAHDNDLYQPYVTGTYVQPYTRPVSVSTDYNKWTKEVTVSWERNETETAYDGSTTKDVNCRTDGKWYVIRYEPGKPNDYTLVNTLNGNASSLKMTDSNIEYDQKYTYRVIFLPDILESTYKDKLTQLPGYQRTRNDYDLWMETDEVETKMEVKIELWQDMKYTAAVRLKWSYGIELDDLTWHIDYRDAGSNKAWQTRSEAPVVDKNQSEAMLDITGSSVCEPKEYRVRVSINGRVLYSNIASTSVPDSTYISEVVASTGTEESSVTVKWKVVSPDRQYDIWYRVLRRVIGDSEWTLLTDDKHGTASEYTFTDTRAVAGSYYEYSVEAYGAQCEAQLTKKNEVIAPGFSQANATITGHVSYGTGTAVQGAKVQLYNVPTEENEIVPQYFSRYISGAGKGLQWRGDSARYASVLQGSKDVTLQLWARPSSFGADQQQLLQLTNAIELGLRRSEGVFHLYAIDRSNGGTDLTEFPALTFSATDFTHITAVYSGGKWRFYMGTDSLRTDSMQVANSGWQAIQTAGTLTFSIGGDNRAAGSAYTGSVDEVRLWSRALPRKEIENNYCRILGGTEKGLFLYWPLDEGLRVVKYAFDVACQDGIYQLNHPEVGANVTPTTDVPKHLGLYGLTDSEGDYIIRGIPFQQGGTNYKIAPELGIHRFNPEKRSMFVSPSSLTANNIDFEDVSSFPMRGHVYYAGTNIPAEGIRFYIDGELVTANGKVKETDAEGKYTISVPIGEHYVEARMEGHTMVAGGRYPLTGTYNFTDEVQHDFFDSTLVNFVGRIGGGTVNDTLPVGFGLSKNNIGVATITLGLNSADLSFNRKQPKVTEYATTDRLFASDTASIRSHASTGVGELSRYIVITTDSATGEFSALLPPLKYITKSIKIGKNSKEIAFTSLPEIDLTNPRAERTDSLRTTNAQGDTVTLNYKYNTKMVQTYFARPQVDVVQVGNPAGAFGMDSIIVKPDDAVSDTLRQLYTVNGDTVAYRFGYPVYQMLDPIEYAIHAYEAYTNYDGAAPVTDTLNLNGQELVIGNEMSASQSVIYDAPEDSTQYTPGKVYQMQHEPVTLDKNGRARVQWTVGYPNIVSPFTRQFYINLTRDDRTYTPFRMDAVVLGQLNTGSNFVTQGPDNVQFILRDPYGAHSKTTLKTGKVYTKSKFNTYQVAGSHTATLAALCGSDVTTGTGVGLMIINHSKVGTIFKGGMTASWKTTHRKDSTFVETTVESISTSDKYPYVGAMGDVYVGTSTNILVGTCRKVHIKKNVQSGKYEIVLEDAQALGQEISTMFAYSQYELEKVMIPKWKSQRKQYLTQVASREAAESYVNHGKSAKWVTWLDPSASNYGEAGTYLFVGPENPEKDERDSVEWCNNQIVAWEECIRRNEEAKVKAMDSKTPQNYSIDGGSSRTFTHRNDTTGFDQKKTDYTVSAVFAWKADWKIGGVASVGIESNTENTVGEGNVYGNGNDSERYTEWEYVLSDGNRDVDLSINMYDAESGNNSKIFTLFGGQTYNPYEPADSTHYYKPNGQPLPLGNGSVRMEEPRISIGDGTGTPGKSLTLTDIPAGQSVNAVLYCSNMSNSHQGRNFSYDLGIIEGRNQKGLEILMDGTPVKGRSILLNQNETAQKVISIRQTDESILDYDSIEIWFMSQYQPALIYDKVLLSVHFQPSSSPVTLTAENPVLNTDVTTGHGKLQLKLSGFNRHFRNLKEIGVQYRFAGNTQWSDLYAWATSVTDTAGSNRTLLPAEGDLRMTLDMLEDIYYPQGMYEFRAYTTTPYGKDPIRAYSEVVTVIKDMKRPRPLYTPAPANGILGIGEQLAVEFNEDIIPGYVGSSNIVITAQLNGKPIDHEVSMRLRPYGEEVRTDNPLFLSGNFAMEFWLNPHESGTILHQGKGDGNFGLSIDPNGYVVVNIAGAKYTSEKAVPMDEWTFFAMNYKAETMLFNMVAQYDTTTLDLFAGQTVSEIEIDKADYRDDNYLYLGPIDANIHDLAIYNIFRDLKEAKTDKYVSKDTYTYGLTNYWHMNEGHGFVAADTRRTHNFIGKDAWDILSKNLSARMDSTNGMQTNISHITTGFNDSYAIELWHDPALFNGADTVFETAVPSVAGDLQAQSEKLCLHYDTAQNLVLDYGVKSRTVASHTDFPEIVSGWHHFALNVVRGQAASFYLDGSRTAVIAEADVPNLSGSALVFAKNAEYAYIDEVRIWKATLSEDRLLSNMYNTIDTAKVYSQGLVGYYPFEKDSTINGVDTKGFTLQNMAPVSIYGNAGDMQSTRHTYVAKTPPLKRAPSETVLTAMPVASERKVVINLAETEVTARDLEGTTLNITLTDVHDLNGNTSEPIKWTAYVQQNTLLWGKDSVNITKQYGEDYTFDVTIENKSGQTEYYTVENMPTWLSLVENEAVSYQPSAISDVQPLKTKTLRFAVNPLVPVGNYEATIGVQGNKGILEPLRIVMKVRGETPNWTVDPTKYDHSMTIIGQVYLSGILMENPESMVAAFIGGECRGVAAPKKIRGAAYETLIIYGSDTPDADRNQPVSFRIWDASKGIAYTDANIQVPNDQMVNEVVFRQDTMIGNFNTPAIWTKSDRVEQLIPVHENWNWIAFGVEPPSEYCDFVFTPQYKGWNVLVKDQETFSQSSGSTFNGPLKLAVNRMYKLRILRTTKTASATLDPQLSVSGKRLSSDSMGVMIEQGWNWLPYTPLSTMTVDEALAGVQPKWGDIIKSQTGVSVYDIYGWEGTLTALEPGHGYLYYSTDSTAKSFVYPDLYRPQSKVETGQSLSKAISRKSKVESQKVYMAYPSNMTMTIRLMDGEAVVDTCEIAAYIGGECRGAVRAHTDSLYYLVIAGDGAGQPMELRTVINGEERVIDKTLTFVSDNHIGTPWEPYVIQLNAAEGIEDVQGDNVQCTKVQKVLINNHIYILRPDGEMYDVTGKRVSEK